MNHQELTFVIIFQLMIALPLVAQDLDPRAYVRLPTGANAMTVGFSYSVGGIVTDQTLLIENAEAEVQRVTLGYAHSFDLFGLSSQAMVALPYSWAQASGDIQNQQQRITRSGFADARMRLTVLVFGAPAVGIEEYIKAPKKTIVGLSINIVAPTGQFFPDKVINLGTHRWSFRPEVGLSQPLSKRWLLDVYSGVWFFTKNKSFYPGNSVRTQEALGTFQGHFSYNINPRLWAALDATYYLGGSSSVNGVYSDNRQANVRVGVTVVTPVGKKYSIKFAASTGAVVRVGQDFTTLSIGLQRSWFGGLKDKAPNTD